MASQSPTSDVRTRSKLPQYAGRLPASVLNAKPLFSTMRRPQFQQDFTTESLNNTAIGSPSPARPLNGASYRVDRPIRGTGLSAAFQRVDERSKNEENKERSIAEETMTKDLLVTMPSTTRLYVTDSPSPSTKIVPPRSRVRTPSPLRGRPLDLMLSPMSEASEASPPREFAEAYKQINDAEDLAAQEDELDVSDDIDGVMVDGQYFEKGQQASRRNSRRRSPGVDDAIILDSPAKRSEEATQDSLPSLPSDLELALAKPTRHEKDLQRLSLALGDAKAFSKAKRRPRITVSGLQRESPSSRSGSRSENSNTSGSILSDGSFNIPHQWGRKARAGRTWVSSLKRGTNFNENTPPIEAVSTKIAAKSQTIEDWQAEASLTPLPLVQDQDPLDHSPSPAPARSSILTARDRVRKLAFGEDNPASRSKEQARNGTKFPTLDMIREREIQYLAKSAVTTNRLGELKEKRSLERVGSRSAGVGFELDPVDLVGIEAEPALKLRPPQTFVHPVMKDGKDDFCNESKDQRVLQQNLKVTKQDTVDRGFAPAKKIEKVQISNFGLEKEAAPILETPAQVQATKSKVYLKTPLVTGAWIDTPLPSIKAERLRQDTKGEINEEFVKYPIQEAASESSGDSSKNVLYAEAEKQKLRETAPKLPGSALAAIITRAKDKNSQGITAQSEDTLLLDESTILSLEDLVASGEESGVSSPESAKLDKVRSKDIIRQKKHKLPTPRVITQESESEANIALTTRLDRLRTSIHDAKAGVGSLQKRINKLPQKPKSTSSSRSPSHSRAQSECDEAGEFHDFIWPCDKCGHKSGSSSWATADEGSILDWHWRPLQIYMPQLWFWPANSSIPRFTTVGWIAILSILLLIIESTL